MSADEIIKDASTNEPHNYIDLYFIAFDRNLSFDEIISSTANL